MPIHIAFLHLVIDPACSVVFEAQPEEGDVMRRPPRDPREPLFGRRVLGVSLLQGASVLVVVLAVYVLALRLGQAQDEARALTFATFLISNLAPSRRSRTCFASHRSARWTSPSASARAPCASRGSRS
jgi:Ca2+-transporting ATPase